MPLNKLRDRALDIVIGLILAGILAWGTWTTRTSMAQETRIVKVETQQEAVKDDIKEIKDSQLRMEEKVDKALEKK